MAMAKKYYWLKLKDNFFQQKEIKKLRKIAGGDTYTIIYLKMQLLSIKDEGKLYFDGIEDDFAAELALEMDEDVENVRVTILFLEKHGLLEFSEINEYTLPAAVAAIGSETASAERVRRFRDNQKALLCNADVTNCNTEKRRVEKRQQQEQNNKVVVVDDLEKINNIFCQYGLSKIVKTRANADYIGVILSLDLESLAQKLAEIQNKTEIKDAVAYLMADLSRFESILSGAEMQKLTKIKPQKEKYEYYVAPEVLADLRREGV